jgi:phosphoglycerate dehydrogenase-like enzyme
MNNGNTKLVITVELEGLVESAERVPGYEIATAYDRHSALEKLRHAEVLCVHRFDAELFRAAPNVKWIHAMMGGVEKILFPELISSNIPLTCVKECFGIPGAQHAMASMLAVSSRLPDYWWQRTRKTHDWRLPHELTGKTIGIIGFGNIGKALATYSKAFGMKVIAMARNSRSDPSPADQLFAPSQFPQLLHQSDFVVLCVPLTDETRGLIGTKQIATMKRSAWFIDISGRPAIVDEVAMIDALKNGVIAGADLQFPTAPPPESPVWTMENLIMSQWSANSDQEGRRCNALFEGNLRRYLNKQPLIGLVDKKAGY